MKNFVLFLIVVGVGIGCQRKKEPIPTIDPRLLITSISFPGIPDKDVTINQVNREIHVKMPAFLAINHIIPTVVVSEDAKLLYQEEIAVVGEINGWSYPRAANLIIRLIGKTDNNQFILYRIIPKAIAPLTLTHTTTLPLFTIGQSDYVYIDVLNIYGNELPKNVSFNNKSTGTQYTLSTVYLDPVMNKIRISAYSVPFELGDYNITFQMPNGNLMQVDQTLKVVQGIPSLDNNNGINWSALAGENLSVRGENLFKESITFQLHDSNGKIIPLTASFYLNGEKAQITIPASLSPGYYGIEIIKDGKPLGKSYRLSVVKNKQQPYIVGLNGFPASNFPTTEPIIFPHNERIVFMSGVIKPPYERTILTLIDEQNSAYTFRFSLTLPAEAYPYFIIPSEIPAGRYKAVIQEIDLTTKELIQQSEPFERVVILQ